MTRRQTTVEEAAAALKKAQDTMRSALAKAAGLRQARLLAALDLPLREARGAFEREYLTVHLARHGGNVSHAAKAIGMERSALSRKLTHLGVIIKD